MLKRALSYFTRFEIGLWAGSVLSTTVAFLLFDRGNVLMLAACIIGATYLIFNAKGNPSGQVLAVIFSLFYAYISYTFAYYGEMITYLGMCTPMALLSLVAWLRNPFQGKRAEVQIATMRKGDICRMLVCTAVVTVLSYFLLGALGNANLVPSTVSVATSFAAAWLTMRRSRFFTLAYAVNDVVLIVLWTLAAMAQQRYIPVVVCFVMFLVNDLYGFVSWSRLQRRQQAAL